MVISLMKHLCPGSGVEAAGISMQGNQMVPTWLVDRIVNPHFQRFLAWLPLYKGIVARQRRRSYRLWFGWLESFQKGFFRRALPHPPPRRRRKRHIRFGLPLIQETSAKREIRRPDSPRLGTNPGRSRGFGRPPGGESVWDSAQRTRFLVPPDAAGLHRAPELESHKRDKRAAHNWLRTA